MANTKIKISDDKTLKQAKLLHDSYETRISESLPLILDIDKKQKTYGGELKWQVEAEQIE